MVHTPRHPRLTFRALEFPDSRVQDPAVLGMAAKIRYAINPNDEYPRNYSGHLRATFIDGRQRECRQPFMRGGVHAPLSTAELEAKFMDNVLYGGWSQASGQRLQRLSTEVFAHRTLAGLIEFRS